MFALSTLIFITHVLPASRGAQLRRPRDRKRKKEKKKRKAKKKGRRKERKEQPGTTHSLYIRRANACTVSGILDNPTRRRDRRYVLGVGKNVKGTYASRNLMRMTMASASLNLFARIKYANVVGKHLRLISRNTFEQATFGGKSYEEKSS